METMVEIADGDPRSDWLPRNEDDRMINANDISEMTGLSVRAAREFLKLPGHGCRVGVRCWYISYGKFKRLMEEIQARGGRIDG